jgi:sortase A
MSPWSAIGREVWQAPISLPGRPARQAGGCRGVGETVVAARIVRVNRSLRILSTALITAGIVVLADAGITLLWQEPVSAAYGSLKQGQARDDLDRLEADYPTSEDLAAVSGVTENAERARILADRFEQRIEQGDAIGRIEIDRIDLDMVFLQGTDTSTLQYGPGHYLKTSLPGQRGTVGIAGHRTTYLAPFRKINEIEDGDEIRLEMPYAAFTYVVEKHEIVDPGDVEIIEPVGDERLVLTACHPLYSAAERWAVFARLERIDLFAIGGGRWPAP